jgi:hypothetical protein
MNEIRYNLASSTLGNVVMAGLVSIAALNPPLEKEALTSNTGPFSRDMYFSRSSGATFDSFRGEISGQYDRTPIQFEHVVGNFYARLLSSQEPLGAEFEKVLHANLWTLYES